MSTPIPILHQDEHLLVVLKPAGILSVPGGAGEGLALPELLARQGLRVIPVHRLDRDVSGAILFALDEETRTRLETQFREHAVRKTYWALAQGNVLPPRGNLHFPLLEEGGFARVSALGRKSLTKYATLESLRDATALEIELVTGRYNQIRVHFAHAGFPLVGERKYARGKEAKVPIKSRRVALHAWRIELAHPQTGKALAFEAPLPLDLQEVLARVRAARKT